MNELNKLVSCAFCRNVLKAPIILPCGETLCSEHISKLLIKKTPTEAEKHPLTRVIACVHCKQEHELPFKDCELVPNKIAERLAHLVKSNHFISLDEQQVKKIKEHSYDWNISHSAWNN